MNRITKVTRRDIFDTINTASINVSLVGIQEEKFCWYGVLTPIEFLERLYNLESLPSYDDRCNNAYEDIYRHTVANPGDYPDEWIFSDERFPLKKGDDEDLLAFLCEMLHPEVRNEKQIMYGCKLWEEVWNRINGLLAPDGYSITCDGNISGRVVLSWIDKTKRNGLEKKILPFLNLFNRGGHVLDFTIPSFNNFTKEHIGVGLCDVYHVSKGKSLTQYLQETDEASAKKLLMALFEYYESRSEFDNERSSDPNYSNFYFQCKEIVKSWGHTSALKQYTAQLEENFSSEYMSREIHLMVAMQKEHPTEAIGKSKELIESCCKTILEERGQEIDKNWNFNQLYDATVTLLHLAPKDVSEEEPKAVKLVLGNLKAVAQGVESLRNTYGSGHGKSAYYKELEERHAKLAIGSSETIVDFLWTTHKNLTEQSHKTS